jgi:cobalt-zinc-cadmium efflux system outer membrane protein
MRFIYGLCLAGYLCAQSPAEKLTLDQAVAEALEKNLVLLAERSSIAIAEARVLTARLRPNPVVSVGGDHMDLLGTGFNDLNNGGPTEFSLRTDFLWERAGKRRLRTEVAEAARSVAQLQFLNSVRGVVLDVQSAFVDALLARDSLALARENLSSLNQIVEINAARVKAGDLAEVELIRSRLAALQFETSVRQAELKLRAALVRLQTFLGRSRPSPSFDVAGDLSRAKAAPALEDLRTSARELRPDLRALNRDRERAEAELRSQIAQGKVDYTLGTEYRRQQVAAKSNSLGVFFSVPLPVFNRNQGEIERARQERQQIHWRLGALEAAIAAEVETAYQQFLTARSLLEAIEGQMVGQARDVREITEFSYKRGEATLLQLLDAQRAFNETMQAYNEARAEYARNLYLLDAVSGKAVTR